MTSIINYGYLSDTDRERNRVCDTALPEVIEATAALRAVVGKLLDAGRKIPETNITSTIDQYDIYLTDQSGVHASIQADGRSDTSRRRIYVSRGLLKFVSSNDELAFILGHELGHPEYEKEMEHDGGQATPFEETGADIIGTCLAMEAGYNPWAGIEFFRKLLLKERGNQKEFVEGLLKSIRDEHPMDENRIAVIRAAIGVYQNHTGRPYNTQSSNDLTAFNALVTTKTKLHKGYYDNALPSDFNNWESAKKLEFLATDFEGWSKYYHADGRSERMKDLIDLLTGLRVDVKNEGVNSTVERMLASIKQTYGDMRGYYAEEMAIALVHAARDENSQKSVAPIGRFGHLNELINTAYRLVEEEAEAILLDKAFDDVLEEYEKHLPYFLRQGKYGDSEEGTPDAITSKVDVRSIMGIGLVQPFTKSIDYGAAVRNRILEIAETNDGALRFSFVAGLLKHSEYERYTSRQLAVLQEIVPIMSGLKMNCGPYSIETRHSMKEIAANMQKAYDTVRRREIREQHRNGIKPSEDFRAYIDLYGKELFLKGEDFPTVWQPKHRKHFLRMGELVAYLHSEQATPTDWLYLESQIKKSQSERSWRRIPAKHPLGRVFIERAKKSGFPASWYSELKKFVKFKSVDVKVLRSFGYSVNESFADIYSTLNATRRFGSAFSNEAIELEIENLLKLKVDKKKNFNFNDLLELSVISSRDADVAKALAQRSPGILKFIGRNPNSFLFSNRKWAQLDTQSSIHLFRIMETFNLFPNTAIARKAAEDVERKIAAEKDPSTALKQCEQLLASWSDRSDERHGNGRYLLKNIGLRDRLIKIWLSRAEEVHGVKGIASQPYVEYLARAIPPRDREEMLRQVADLAIIQPEQAKYFSAAVKGKIGEGSKKGEEKNPLDKFAAGTQMFMEFVSEYDDLRNAFLDFLADGTPRSIKKLRTIGIKYAKSKQDKFSDSDREELLYFFIGADKDKQDHAFRLWLELRYEDKALNTATDFTLASFRDYYESLDIKAKAGLLSFALISPKKTVESEADFEAAFKIASKKAMDKILPATSNSARAARAVFESFLSVTDPGFRLPLLAATIASKENVSTGGNSTAKYGKLVANVLSKLGGAYVKFGQRIPSHPDCPEEWREDLNKLKDTAETSVRWQVLERAEAVVPEKLRGRIKRYGKIWGAASVNTAIEVELVDEDGKREPLMLLLQGVHSTERMEDGFKTIGGTLEECRHPLVAKHREGAVDIVDSARVMTRGETDCAILDMKHRVANEVYEVTNPPIIKILEQGKLTNVELVACQSRYSGDEFRMVTIAHGTLFKNMPDGDPDKHIAAKAYMAFELTKILSGQPFDYDRHGGQMRVQKMPDGSLRLGLFDFGGMALEPATPEEIECLRQAIRDTTKYIASGLNISDAVAKAINATETEGREYLSRIREAWIGLSDFTRALSKQDFIEIAEHLMANPLTKVVMEESIDGALSDVEQRSGKIVLGALKLFSRFQQQANDIVAPTIFVRETDAAATAAAPNPLRRTALRLAVSGMR